MGEVHENGKLIQTELGCVLCLDLHSGWKMFRESGDHGCHLMPLIVRQTDAVVVDLLFFKAHLHKAENSAILNARIVAPILKFVDRVADEGVQLRRAVLENGKVVCGSPSRQILVYRVLVVFKRCCHLPVRQVISDSKRGEAFGVVLASLVMKWFERRKGTVTQRHNHHSLCRLRSWRSGHALNQSLLLSLHNFLFFEILALVVAHSFVTRRATFLFAIYVQPDVDGDCKKLEHYGGDQRDRQRAQGDFGVPH